MKKIKVLILFALIALITLGNNTRVQAKDIIDKNSGYKVDPTYEWANNKRLLKLTRVIKTQKELEKYCKDERYEYLILQPDKETTFDLAGLHVASEMHIFVKNVNIVNGTKSRWTNYITMYVENPKELEKALKMADTELHSTLSIRVTTNEKYTFKPNIKTFVSIHVDAPNSNWVLNVPTGIFIIKNIKNGYVADKVNSILNVEGPVKKIIVGSDCTSTVIDFVEKLDKKVKVELKGQVKFIGTGWNTPIELLFPESSKADKIMFSNQSGEKMKLKVNGKSITIKDIRVDIYPDGKVVKRPFATIETD